MHTPVIIAIALIVMVHSAPLSRLPVPTDDDPLLVIYQQILQQHTALSSNLTDIKLALSSLHTRPPISPTSDSECISRINALAATATLHTHQLTSMSSEMNRQLSTLQTTLGGLQTYIVSHLSSLEK